MKSHADYLRFDTSTDEGRRALLDQVVDDLIAFVEPIEQLLRDPRDGQRLRLDAAVMRSLWISHAMDPSKGYEVPRPEARPFGRVGLLIGLVSTIADVDTRGLWTALDDVRARRDERRKQA